MCFRKKYSLDVKMLGGPNISFANWQSYEWLINIWYNGILAASYNGGRYAWRAPREDESSVFPKKGGYVNYYGSFSTSCPVTCIRETRWMAWRWLSLFARRPLNLETRPKENWGKPSPLPQKNGLVLSWKLLCANRDYFNVNMRPGNPGK